MHSSIHGLYAVVMTCASMARPRIRSCTIPQCELAHTSLQVGVEWKDSPTPPPSTKAPPVRALETGMDGAMDGAKQAMEGAKKAAEGAKKAASFLKGVADKFSKKE